MRKMVGNRTEKRTRKVQVERKLNCIAGPDPKQLYKSAPCWVCTPQWHEQAAALAPALSMPLLVTWSTVHSHHNGTRRTVARHETRKNLSIRALHVWANEAMKIMETFIMDQRASDTMQSQTSILSKTEFNKIREALCLARLAGHFLITPSITVLLPIVNDLRKRTFQSIVWLPDRQQQRQVAIDLAVAPSLLYTHSGTQRPADSQDASVLGGPWYQR